MIRTAGVTFAVLFALCTRAAAEETAAEKRVRFLAESLKAPITEIDKGDLPLKFLLETITALASKPGAVKDPSLKVTIQINVDAFCRETMDIFDPEEKSIKFPYRLLEMNATTILDMICDQLDGVALVRNDYIEIVPRGAAMRELNIQIAKDEPMPRLVHEFFSKSPLEKALQQIAEQSNANIVLAPQAAAKGETPITARLVNVPIDAAVETIADMAGLKVVRRANVFLVTTKEQANEIEAELEKARCAKRPDTPKLEAPPRKEKN